jgi:hypothetical protein
MSSSIDEDGASEMSDNLDMPDKSAEDGYDRHFKDWLQR